jgi:hypothetical protein
MAALCTMPTSRGSPRYRVRQDGSPNNMYAEEERRISGNQWGAGEGTDLFC